MTEKASKQFQGMPLLFFTAPDEFTAWLAKHHQNSPTVWLRFYKKASGIPSLNYDQALDVALCYGWIDSQVKSFDEKSYVQKFGPRQSKSPWSELNKKHVARLIKEGRMQKAGRAAIELAKNNGNWDKAQATPSETKPSPEFQKALDNNSKAKEFFESLSKTQQFYFSYWIITAKREETREKRIKEAISMLERREKRM